MPNLLKYILIPLVLMIASCGSKAPDVGSSDVEDLIVSILKEKVFGSVEKAPESLEVTVVEIIKTDVDNEAQRTEFTFRVRERKSTKHDWEVSTQFEGIASYSESGELFVEVLFN